MTHQTVGLPGLPDDPRADAAEPVPSCPVEITLDALRGRWTTLVVRELLRADRSFSDLRQALPLFRTRCWPTAWPIFSRRACSNGAGSRAGRPGPDTR
ncbi:winged helix-turn-helix transcriptional regulator [Actinomadura madurae]|uniref:winged helix-turn-helix transcriptional regulator n=1 Tax=Actinomadura madurae TaxID=1993 RepID=UPI0020D22AA4|nr:hypothetical protein [Actinomadura madurae]MCQ0006739.1 hypothetical protein [Actinomadura madurae]